MPDTPTRYRLQHGPGGPNWAPVTDQAPKKRRTWIWVAGGGVLAAGVAVLVVLGLS